MGEKALRKRKQNEFQLKRIFRYLVLCSGIWPLAKIASYYPGSWGDWAEIRLTENCNSRCITCNAWKHRSTNELTIEEFCNIFDQLRALGASKISFSGGETLLRPDATAIIREAKSKGFEEIIVKTNGLLLEERSPELVKCGITYLMVSLDGMHDIDNSIRGVPFHFEKAVAGIRALNKLKEKKNVNLKIVILTTLLGLNAVDIPRLIELCNELKASWNMNLLDCNMDLFKNIDVQKLLKFSNQEMIDSFFDSLREKQQKYPSVAHFCSHELDYAKDFLKGDAKNGPCINGYQGIGIGPHGEVYSNCLALPPVGNVRENPLSQIIASDHYRKRLTRMYRRQCPGCTFYWPENVAAAHIVSHSLICERRLATLFGRLR
jgi:MoaA/NifB/PqqE/SkfB family radical SAM enzyme